MAIFGANIEWILGRLQTPRPARAEMEKAIRLGLNPEPPRYWDIARGDGVSVGGRFPTKWQCAPGIYLHTGYRQISRPGIK